jgi:hypothetical protein
MSYSDTGLGEGIQHFLPVTDLGEGIQHFLL